MGSSRKILHFYPGQKKLIFVDGKQILAAEAWGGPGVIVKSPNMDQIPTTPGEYVIYGQEAYRTDSWPWSRIRWGTKLRDTKQDVLYQIHATWGSVFKDYKITRLAIIARNLELYGVSRVPDAWVFNDFGPIAIRYFKDLNKNGKFDGKEQLMGEMFHTTPENEAAQARNQSLTMQESHGCIHLRPLQRNELIRAGAFQYGTPLVIHRYDEKAGN